jgi:hypothetical protein
MSFKIQAQVQCSIVLMHHTDEVNVQKAGAFKSRSAGVQAFMLIYKYENLDVVRSQPLMDVRHNPLVPWFDPRSWALYFQGHPFP